MDVNSQIKFLRRSGREDYWSQRKICKQTQIETVNKDVCNLEDINMKSSSAKEKASSSKHHKPSTENVTPKSRRDDVGTSGEDLKKRTESYLSTENKYASSKSSSSKRKYPPDADMPELKSGCTTSKNQPSKKQTKSKTSTRVGLNILKSELPVSESDNSTEEEERLIPSKVKNIPWIHAVSVSSRTRKTDPLYEGKWMIYANCQSKDKKGLTKLDQLWIKIVEMVQSDASNALYKAHASTGFPCTKPPKEAGHGSGTICCVTRDYRDEEDVKLTAERIMSKLSGVYNGYLLYKTNEARENEGISLYRYLKGGTFWKRSEDGF